MHKIWTLVKREYSESVFKKSFIIMTIITPLLLVAMGIIPSLLVMMETEDQVRLRILDRTGKLYEPFSSSLQDTLQNGQPRFVHELSETNDSSAVLLGKNLVETQAIDGFLIIPKDVFRRNQITYFSRNVANFDDTNLIESTIQNLADQHRIKNSGLDAGIINELTADIRLKTIKITSEGTESERGFGEEYLSTFILVLIIYVTLLIYGNSVMRSIVHEKSSRIIEVLLSSANPFQLMAGKILGQGFVGFTQYLLWSLTGIGLVLFGSKALPVSSNFLKMDAMIFVYFIIFYILGYFIFATLYAAVGAISNSEQDAQQMATPVVFMLIIPIMIIGFLVKSPDSSLAITLSMIPFFSPIIMFARINLSNPGFLQIGTSILILILSTVFLIWITGKIFRVGILMYGKRPTLPEIIKWIKY